MSPHGRDGAMRRACEDLLYIDARATPRTRSGRIRLDWASAEQQAFQAILASCLMNSVNAPCPVEHPERPYFAAPPSYLNSVGSRSEGLEIYTNTASRIAARLLPSLFEGRRVVGVPGLRLIDHNHRRLRLVHVPTSARLDLVDSNLSDPYTVRDMRRFLQSETSMHTRPDLQLLWEDDQMSANEDQHADLCRPP